MNLFATMQEEIGTAQLEWCACRAMRSRPSCSWALLQCGDNCPPWEEHELPSGRFARFATGAEIVSWMCQLVGARDDEYAFAATARRRLPTRSRSFTACRRARRCCRFTASGRRTKRRPRKCSSTAATSSIQRAARCSKTTDRGRAADGAGGERRLLCSCDRASCCRAPGRRTRPKRTRATARTSSASATSSTASAAGWRRK
jgi:hypothetical protein